MARTKISEFSATPANNTDIDSINIAEGCAPSGINDAIRELMAQLKDFQTGAVGDSFNGPVGTTTAAAGAFTTLSASSTVSGTGFSTYLASPPAIGGTAAAAGSFTTLSASGNVTLSGGTANGVAYLNGSKVVTSGSALTFDGTNLGVGSATVSDFSGTVLAVHAASGSAARIKLTNSTSGTTSGDGGGITYDTSNNLTLLNRESSGAIIFSPESATEAMRLTSTGLGIGTSSPSYKLDVNKGSSGVVQRWNTGSVSMLVEADHSGNGNWFLSPQGTATFNVKTNGSTRLTVDSSGNLGIGTSSPSASAILDAQSTTKGVRMPNMTTTQKNAIASPAAGLMVFDTTLAKLCVYTGAAWQTITSV